MNLKFRVWDKKYRGWAKDNYIGVDATGQILSYKSYSLHGEIIGGWIKDKNDDFIVQQFTGYSDKNGKEIYEGDITKTIIDAKNKNPRPYIMDVKFENGMFNIHSSSSPDSGCEVIGNIFENPELLK